MKKLAALLAGAMLMMATSALAIPIPTNGFNDNRSFTPGVSSEPSLQSILDNTFGSNKLNAVTSQSSVGAWTLSDSNSSTSYLVNLFSAATNGQLFIYSKTDPTKNALLLNTTNNDESSFTINTAKDGGTLKINSTVALTNFGSSFGFFWQSYYSGFNPNPQRGYTEDYLNNSGYGPTANIRALTYIVPTGTELGGSLSGRGMASGGDDWAMAFEDYAPNGDYDFNDAVFYVKDLSPVPEPGTMVLLGFGMLGLAIYGKRRMNKEA